MTSKLQILCILAAFSIATALANGDTKDLPGGPGKELVAKVCIDCHAATFRKARFSEDEWIDKVGDMVERGAKADEKQQAEIVVYLAHNFGKNAKVNMNTAPHSALMVVLGFIVDESKALVDYRSGHGVFKKWGDVAKVPGVDSKRVEALKDKMVFGTL